MKFLIAFLTLVVILGAGGFWWWTKQVQAPDATSTTKQAFVIANNQTAGEIVDQLAGKGLIKSPLVARLFLVISGLEKKLQAGSFVLSPNQSLAEIFQSLTGPPEDVWVTIPEGWRHEQIAARMQATLAGPASQFDANAFLAASATLEGQLFPDTYLIPVSATSDQVIKIMLANFGAKSQLSLPTDRSTLVLASVVEREGITASDRPIIAGILQKRLQAGWPLQVDASLQYGRDTISCKATLLTCKYWEPLVDTHFASVYNTYLHTGLPPTPIANPGLASITAAKDPQKSSYWFYLHTPDGSVYYAQTADEHARNIDKYLRR